MNALIDNYTKDELEYIVKNSKCVNEIINKLGYKTHNGRSHKTVMDRIKKYNIPYDHFESVAPQKRNYDNIFCNNSTASQATLRKWYKKIVKDDFCRICNRPKLWEGKELTMILDHIDGDNHNNQIENLRWICPNCNSQLPTFAGRNIKNRKNYVSMSHRKQYKKICPICNINEINKQSKMCIECRNKEKAKNIPLKEELESKIYTRSFTSIAKDYGVTDNAVRKWCKKYNLPYRYGDLHKYKK